MTPDPSDSGPKVAAKTDEKWSVDDLLSPRGSAAFGVERYEMAGALHGHARKTFTPDAVRKALKDFANHEAEVDVPNAEEA